MGSLMIAREEMGSAFDAACAGSRCCPVGGADDMGVRIHAPCGPCTAPAVLGARYDVCCFTIARINDVF